MSSKEGIAACVLLASAAAIPATVVAQDAPADAPPPQKGFFSSLFENVDFSIGGFIRGETAIQATDTENPYNQGGNPYNNISAFRQAYVPPNSANAAINGLGLPLPGVPNATTWTSVPVANVPGVVTGSDTVRRPIANSNNVFNLHIVRSETEVGIKFGNDLKFIGRVRAIAEPGHYSDFNAAEYTRQFDGGIDGGQRALYGGAPNYFQYIVEGDKHPNPLEIAGPNYMVDFPALVLDYNHGPLNVRIGNQSIAWGQALFFRVLDTPNGLDLRRHSILDYAQEEFADKRVPSPAIRIGYQVTDEILADAFVEKFQPTVFGNPNTQYNVIPVQFTVQDMYHRGHYDDWDKLNYGIRFKGNFGQFGFQAIAVERYNPDGVFRWTTSNVNKALPATITNNEPNGLGTTVNTTNDPTGTNNGAGPALAGTPFEASPGGVYSANEWFHYASLVRLDGIQGLNAAINEYQPSTGKVYASPVNNYAEAVAELNTFFIASGGLRGHIAREYAQETVLGLGASYVTEAEPGSIWDQIIFNLESSYTLNRTYTATTLSRNYPQKDSSVTALVVEKYHRFSQSFPATYFVLQYEHRNKDDLFGRLLSGYGASDAGTYDANATTAVRGISQANYVVFAFQQPLPQSIYRFGFATLYDPRGGILVQPGVQYKPSGHLSFDLFYSYINGHLGGNPNNNVLSTADFADEVTVRVGYQF